MPLISKWQYLNVERLDSQRDSPWSSFVIGLSYRGSAYFGRFSGGLCVSFLHTESIGLLLTRLVNINWSLTIRKGGKSLDSLARWVIFAHPLT